MSVEIAIEIQRLQKELERLQKDMATVAEALGTTESALLILEPTALIEIRVLPVLVSLGIDIQYVFTGIRYDQSAHSLDVRAKQNLTESNYNMLLDLVKELEDKSRHKKLIKGLSSNELKEDNE